MTSIPESDPSTFWGWVALQDPALAAYANRAEHTSDERFAFLMGMAAGRLDATHELLGYHDEAGTTDLADALAKYLFVLKVLRRQRDSVQVARALARHMKTPNEGGPNGPPPTT